jgi:hypothetical protein
MQCVLEMKQPTIYICFHLQAMYIVTRIEKKPKKTKTPNATVPRKCP